MWPTAIRYLRVDRGYPVRDRDKESGFILFEFPLESQDGTPRTGEGSMELYPIEDAVGRPSVQIQVATSNGPTYLPHAIVEGLAAKVRAERGQPSAPPSRKPPEPSPPGNKTKPDAEAPPPGR